MARRLVHSPLILTRNTRSLCGSPLHLHSPAHQHVAPFPGDEDDDRPDAGYAHNLSVQHHNSSSLNVSANNRTESMEGLWIMLGFMTIFVVLVLASIYVFCDNLFPKTKSKANSITHQNTDIDHNWNAKLSRSFDHFSSANSYASRYNLYNEDYIIETTESVQTSPTKRWLLTYVLGKGRFGICHLAIDLEQKPNLSDLSAVQLYGVKRAMFEIGDNGECISTKECKSIYDEMKILVGLKHENIVKFYGSAICNRSVLMFMEYCQIGNLSQVLKQFGPLDLITAQKYIRQLLSAIHYLHEIQQIVHRDIKGRNILITSNNIVKLADFGASLCCANHPHNNSKESNHSMGGTVHWMPPEIFYLHDRDQKVNVYKHDIWSLGVTVVEMLTCHPLHFNLKPHQYSSLLKNNVSKVKACVPVMDNEHLNKFIAKCLNINHRNRPTAIDLLDNDEFVRLQLCDEDHADEHYIASNFETFIQQKQNKTMSKVHKIIRCNERYFGESQSIPLVLMNDSFD